MLFSKLIIEATEALDRMLKTDQDQKAEKTFTAHLLKQLRIREEKKKLQIEIPGEENDRKSHRL